MNVPDQVVVVVHDEDHNILENHVVLLKEAHEGAAMTITVIVGEQILMVRDFNFRIDVSKG